MTCGIYQLTFASGNLYIGQSVNIESRWKQHSDKMRNGIAAKPMQQEYNRYGLPASVVLLECHKDHLDMMEAMYINARIIQNKSKVLNTDIPKDYTNEQVAFISAHEHYLKSSTFELMRSLNTAKDNITRLENTLAELEDEGLYLPIEARNKNKDLEIAVEKLITINQELSRRANMNWFERLFN